VQHCQFTSESRAFPAQYGTIVFIHALEPKGFSKLEFRVCWNQSFRDLLVQVVEMTQNYSITLMPTSNTHLRESHPTIMQRYPSVVSRKFLKKKNGLIDNCTKHMAGVSFCFYNQTFANQKIDTSIGR
jgi:hypothetical protein